MVITRNEFILAINQIASERGIAPEDVFASIEEAVLVAYRKETDDDSEEIFAKIDPQTGEVKILDKQGNDITPKNFGRIAAQTAKQVILQKIRTVEKLRTIKAFEERVGDIVKARVIRRDNRNVYMDIGRAEGLLPVEEQVDKENYKPNSVFTVLIKEIREDKFGNQRIILSRRDNRLLEQLLRREVPEIESGAVEIKKIVRAPGERAKVAVYSKSKIIDAVGACVGQKGVRVQTITKELGENEKIDILNYSQDLKEMIRSALAPAKVEKIEVDEKNKTAKVYVNEDQAALAIGQKGVNVNLTVKLTGYDIDIIQVKSDTSETDNSFKDTQQAEKKSEKS
ncbi:MAG: transcription termination/antitermination protein NusA [Patescibacteria group bacterium]|nr:MAG: transcription termination/antitermination protein NusA [Patescibacteria group bacterium]